MRTISESELRNHSAMVMDSVEAGETYHITRRGTEVAELRPLTHRRRLTSEQLIEKYRSLPHVDPERMRAEAGDFCGDSDRVAEEAR